MGGGGARGRYLLALHSTDCVSHCGQCCCAAPCRLSHAVFGKSQWLLHDQVVVEVAVTIQVAAVDAQAAVHHHSFNRTPAQVLGHWRAAIVSARFSRKRRGKKESEF